MWREKPDPYAYYLMGYALYKMKRHSESAKYFQEAYTIDPTISPKSVKELLKKKC
jgi:TolA-binding protein